MNNKLEINVAKDYKISNLADSNIVSGLKDVIIESQVLGKYTQIELDIINHMLGYPASPSFIDLFLFHLKSLDGKKKLTIKMSRISYHEWVLVNMIVQEGEFFGITKKIESEDELEQNKVIINNKLKTHNIKLKIVINDNHEPNEYTYG